MTIKMIRGGKGLGDALYVQSVARYLCERGQKLRVATVWPDVFRPLARYGIETTDFTRQGISYLAHYSLRKPQPTRQWQDVCLTAGIKEPVDLRIDWERTSDLGLCLRRSAGSTPIVAVQLPRVPMDRKDTFGNSLLPDCRVIQRLIDMARARGATIIQIGSGKPIFNFERVDVSFANRTSVCELFDIAMEVDAFLGYVSFMVPLAESLNKRSLSVWSSRGLKDGHAYVRQITPQKILEKPTSRWVMDTANERQLEDAANELL